MKDDVGNLKIRPLSPELLEQAMKKLNEDPKRREADVKAIRDWLSKQKHIIADPDDQLIIGFLRGCKFSLERTKEKLDTYYTIKTMAPEIFKNRDLTKNKALREMVETGYFFPVGYDDNGCRVTMCLIGKDDPLGKIKVEDIIKVNVMVLEHTLMNDDNSTVNGDVSILDLSQAKTAYATQMMPSLIKKANICTMDAFPMRPQGIHFIHMPTFFEVAFKLFQSLSKEKLNRRMFIHGKDQEKLFQKVPRRILPKNYDGEAASVPELSSEFVKNIIAFNDWYVADEKNGVDESKRAKPKTRADIFGMEGSFRQLNID